VLVAPLSNKGGTRVDHGGYGKVESTYNGSDRYRRLVARVMEAWREG
jgi:hypothetical protein